MQFDKSGEWLQAAEVIPSDNCDLRPEGVEPDLIVVHGISLPPNQFGGDGVKQLFTNQLDPAEDPYYQQIAGLRVSAHFFIRRDGQVIQFVPPSKRAWHAGVSEYCGKQRCNDFSIGIELEGADHILYTASQYQSLAELIRSLWQLYPKMPKEAIVGHSDIAPGRKTDPGDSFVWATLHRLLAEPS